MKNDINAQIWKFFDRVFCISIKTRTDRRNAAFREFEKVGLGKRVGFMVVEKHPRDCEQGIFESHMACLKKGLETFAETIVVFEDDIVFNRFNPEILKRSIDFMKTHKGWDIVFFGCLVTQSQKTKNKNIRKINYQSLAHAYVVNRAFAKKLVMKKWNRVPYDVMLRELAPKAYAMCPSFSFQRRAASDNDRLKKLEQFRNLFGGLAFIQKANEFYHLHRFKVIGAHILGVAAIIGWMLW